MVAIRRGHGQRLLLFAAGLLVLVLVRVSWVALVRSAKERVEESEAPLTELTPTAALQRLCLEMSCTRGGLAPDVRHVMSEVCEQLGNVGPPPVEPTGCQKSVTYDPIGRLGNLMGLYAIIYSFGRLYGSTGYVESGTWSTLHKYFPNISLKSMKDAPADADWEEISYQQAPAKLECRPGEGGEPRFFRITDWPVRNGIDVFHPFKGEMRKEFTFSMSLQSEAQQFLQTARGSRSSVTYIGFHVRRTDFEAYVRKKYHRTLPDVEYFDRALDYYRRRFADALFIVCSDDLDFVTERLRAKQSDDIVIAGNRDIGDPGRDMALLAACNHSVVTVGTYGFWGAYLAGGTVLVPDEKAHLSRPNGSVPLLVVQKAGATNYVTLWS